MQIIINYVVFGNEWRNLEENLEVNELVYPKHVHIISENYLEINDAMKLLKQLEVF